MAKNNNNVPAGRRKGMKLGTRNTLVGLSFIAPNFIGFFIFILIPVAFSFVLSFMKWDGFTEMTFVGLDNFVKIFKDQYFVQALGRTLYYAVFAVTLTTFAALGLAVLVNKGIKAVGFFRSSIFFPYVASTVAVGAVWRQLFMKDYGPINAFLQLIGIENPPGWLASSKWALPAVIIVTVWKSMGYFMIVYLGALQNIPQELEEASALDGASKFQHFWRITFPMLAPSTFFVVLMNIINSFKAFDLIWVLTEGGPGQATTLMVNYIYNNGFNTTTPKYGIASAAAMVLFAIVAIITIVQFRVEKRTSN
ncbi:sugar ABC transporter permease [Ruminococcaceae bacterium OttesenSCG-928-A16]|nr:sugar ABC transporter permease [Ruminococcaceae bacterium OttesenSCG-928-A16]